MLKRLLPFLEWSKGYTLAGLRADILSGLTVALVLIPQSMAYAQLAGLPVYYGLYASFLPPLVAALFGSSRHLATGPVAVVSLMTAATLEPLAAAGTPGYVAYAILLALSVGMFQLALGVLRLGVVVNFLSHPVVNGFTNAAAVIIATSQLSKLFGVHVDSAEHHYETVARVVSSAIRYTHLPTLLLATLSFAVMIGLKRLSRRIPYVLAAVAVTTVISWATGFEHRVETPMSRIRSEEVTETLVGFNAQIAEIGALTTQRTEQSELYEVVEEKYGSGSPEEIRSRSQIEILTARIQGAQHEACATREHLRALLLSAVDRGEAGLQFYLPDEVPAGDSTDGRRWRFELGCHPIDVSAVSLNGGGDVVGSIPAGLPAISMPDFDGGILTRLFGAAAIISLLGFMEAISIAKAISVKTGQRLDPNQELIGQGLANIAGAFSQSYPTSGSFSRSAVNLQAGAVTGLSSVFTSAVVTVVLLFFTPLLYHLPQAVLASVIMMAVLGLVNITGFIHAWRAKRSDGAIVAVSFLCTLGFAPHLDKGILIGVGLSIALFLYEYTKPRVTVLSRHQDGSYRDSERWGLEKCRHILPIRFYGKLFFANTSALEKKLLELVGKNPELGTIVIVGNGISDIDASGEEILDQIVDEMRRRGLRVAFSGLRDPVRDVLTRTRLLEKIGEENFFASMEQASRALCGAAQKVGEPHRCPLCECAPEPAPAEVRAGEGSR